jgi:hypothetical protein
LFKNSSSGFWALSYFPFLLQIITFFLETRNS